MDPEGGEIARVYDDEGNLVSVTNENGDTTSFTYGALGEFLNAPVLELSRHGGPVFGSPLPADLAASDEVLAR